MIDKKDSSLLRNDGKYAFTNAGKSLAPMRASSPNSRIRRILGNGGPFTDDFKHLILSDYDRILERFHLGAELKGFKRVLQALEKRPLDPNCANLLERLKSDPKNRAVPCFLCPIWRHEYTLDQVSFAHMRYVFPSKKSELYLFTPIFGFAENLDELEELIVNSHKSLKLAVSRMSKRRRGVVMLGAFEPDLRSYDELMGGKKDLVKLMKQLGRDVPQSGGWVLSGHFLVRVPHLDELQSIFNKMFPGPKFDRMQFKSIRKNRDLMFTLMEIMGYASKYPKKLFDSPSRGEMMGKMNREMKSLLAAFHGPNFIQAEAISNSFDIDAAIRQWALFMDKMGSDRMYYSVESVHAQKWYSESEWKIIRIVDFDVRGDGEHMEEIHRDTGPFSRYKIPGRLKGKLKYLRSRPLAYDPEWVRETDLDNVDPFTQPFCFESWITR